MRFQVVIGSIEMRFQVVIGSIEMRFQVVCRDEVSGCKPPTLNLEQRGDPNAVTRMLPTLNPKP